MRKLYKSAILFLIGGALYLLIEVLWRLAMNSTPTHWSMFFIGGLAFLLIGGINEWIPWELSLVKQSLIGTVMILITEFVSGCILNLWLGLGIWDYSGKFLNICGQICPQFAIGWFFLAAIAILLDDYLRYWLFDEAEPHYHIFAPKRRKRKMKKKKTEFSKMLVTWALVITTLCVALSYCLSFTDHDPASDVTVAVATACIAIAVAYEAKSFGEKNSRNKYGIDDDGKKIPSAPTDDEVLG